MSTNTNKRLLIIKRLPFYVIDIIKQTTVEPIGFLNFLAFHIFILTLQTGLYDVVCHQLYDTDRSVNCSNLRANKHAEDRVQQTASQWNIIFALAHFLPAIVAHILLGAWSDKSGRKINILIGLVGLLLNVFPLTVIFVFKNVSLWFLALSSFISGATGYIGMITISSFAYLSDITENRDQLSFRMMNYSLAISVAGITGPLAAATLLRKSQFAYIIVFVEVVLTVAFIYTLIRLRQISPMAIKQSRQRATVSNIVGRCSIDNSIVHRNKLIIAKVTVSSMLNDVKQLLNDVWRTYRKSRPGKRRAYLLVCSLVYFLCIFAEMGLRGNVTSLYVFRRPLEWSGSQLADWKTVQNALLYSGTLIGAVVFKKFLKLRETTIMLIALASGVLELLVTAFASTTWLMYAAVGTGMFTYLFVPTCKAFTSRLVDTDEVGKSYTAFGLAADLGYGLSNMLANAIYSGTLKQFAGFIFILGSCFYAVSFCLIFWVHLDSAILKKTTIDNVVENEITTTCTNVSSVVETNCDSTTLNIKPDHV